jgi:hypothetical protein
MQWSYSNGIDTCIVIRAILTLRVILCQDSRFIVRINGRELKKKYTDRFEARRDAEKAIKHVITSLQKTIGE